MDAPLMLSVSGLRGLVGSSLTPVVAARYGGAIGSWLRAKKAAAGDRAAPVVVLGRDSRPSGPTVEHAVTAGLLGTGCNVVRVGVVTTPTVAVMVENLRADGGVVVTASHNPIIWNGIKTLRHDGVAPPPAEAATIIQRFKEDRFDFVTVDQLGESTQDATATRVHVQRVLAVTDAALVRKARLRVVVDSVHGAGGEGAAMLLEALGVENVHLFREPTGRFPHTPEPTRENLVGLCDAVRQHHAHLGFAQDPDADRLAIVDDQGAYIGEEYTLALTTLRALERTAGDNRCVAANLSTSRMIDDIAARHRARVVRTPVGEANVADAMRTHHAVIGGEGNGGVILPPVVHVRDSLAGMALTLELLAARGKTLSTIVREFPAYAILKDKIDLQPGMAQRITPTLKAAFARHQLDDRDGVRIDWPDRWVHARTSNTEPIMRIIAEAPTEPAARDLITQVRAALGLPAN